ncbi:tetratricopeptide repeat-containing sensor histidine kinase [Zhouia amylolytica]|uniref:Signal transduction histidine kinase internal region domain-containing protein n=1 Tax=Zhouia amylolytica AD3 TaxID=1286632 RepID=W2ULC6_9FLAO|nr:histidine kinase [Zhouia amylolytica]ETN94803.1 hypothetical protein P278_27460 [Zhouia amylolytica AD3]
MSIAKKCTFLLLLVHGLSTLASQKPMEADLKSIQNQGDSLMRAEQFDKAIACFNTVHKYALKNNDSLSIALAFNGIGSVHLYQKELDSAVHFYFKGLPYVSDQPIKIERVKILNNLAIVHTHLRQYQKAKSFFQEALPHSEGNLRLSILSNSYGVYLQLKEFHNAERTLKEAIYLADKLQNPYVKSVLYTNQADFYIRRKQWEEALNAGFKGLKLKEQIQNKDNVVVLNNIGYAYHQLGELTKALQYYQKGLHRASLQEKVQLYKNLKTLMVDRGNDHEALLYFEKYDSIKEVLQAEEFSNKIAELEQQYESAQKQQAIEALEEENNLQKQLIKQQNYIGVFVLLLSFLVAAIVYVWFKQKNTRQELQRASLQQKLLLSQLSPHFIFNALQSIQSYLFLSKTESAMEYLHGFGSLIRGVLESSDKECITLAQEIDILENYLLLQQAGSQNHLKYDIVTESISSEKIQQIRLPGMLIQPFVENAVIHGVKDIENARVLVKFAYANDYLNITVIDNGTGISESNTSAKNGLYTSMGMNIIQKRIQTFNQTHKKKLFLKIENYSRDKQYPGVRVSIEIPVLNS